MPWRLSTVKYKDSPQSREDAKKDSRFFTYNNHNALAVKYSKIKDSPRRREDAKKDLRSFTQCNLSALAA